MSDQLTQAAALPAAPEPEKKPLRWGRVLLVALLSVLLLVPGLGWAAYKGWVPAGAVNAVAGLMVGRQPGALPWSGDVPVNVLLLGLQIGGASTNPLTDAIMIASYDPKSESLSLLSVPRDLYVEIPGYGHGRINEAFQAGGPVGAMLTVQKNLGIPINYYALVSYTAFERLIDNLGGVTIEVARDLNDPYFPAPDMQRYEPLLIQAGVHQMDGKLALKYARSRQTDPLGDIGRAQRQQQVLLALKSQVLRPGNILKLGAILRDARATVITNFPFDQAAGLGLKVLRTEKSRVKSDVLQYENQAIAGWVTPSGASVLVPNKQVVQGIVSNLFGPALSHLQAGATVRVDNGNGYLNAATNHGNLLAGLGVKVVPPGDADRADYPTSSVRVYTKERAKVQQAALLAGMLGVPLEEGSGSEKEDVVITLGRDYAPYLKVTEKDWQQWLTPR